MPAFAAAVTSPARSEWLAKRGAGVETNSCNTTFDDARDRSVCKRLTADVTMVIDWSKHWTFGDRCSVDPSPHDAYLAKGWIATVGNICFTPHSFLIGCASANERHNPLFFSDGGDGLRDGCYLAPGIRSG